MTKIKFYKGLRSSYDIKKHGTGQYYAFDTGEILVNGKAYGVSKELSSQINDITNKLNELNAKQINVTDPSSGETKALDEVIFENETVTAASLNDLNEKIMAIENANFGDSINNAISTAKEDATTKANAAKEAAISASDVTLVHDDGTLTYTLYQGTDNKSEIGKINIPKDMVVESGSVITATDNDHKNDSTVVVGEKYIKLVVANVDKPLYIAVHDLYKDHTAAENAKEVQVAISDDNVISATIVKVDASKVTLNDPEGTNLQDALGTINSTLNGKQNVISDLSTIRSGAAAGATAYQKPAGGIPKTDLAEDVLAFEKGTGVNSAKLKGADNIVEGNNSVATGEHNYVLDIDSLVAGKFNTLTKAHDYAFGQYNVINSSNSTVIGTQNVVHNQNSYAEGVGLRGGGKFSHIEGYGRLDITISGVANSTTYSIVEDLPAIFIGSDVGLAVDNGFLFTYITAIDAVNHTITVAKTLNPDSDFVNKTIKLLCSQNLQDAGHVEGKYNLLLINDEITENPLIGSFIEQYYSTHRDEIEAAHIEGYGNICGSRTSHVEGNFNIAVKAGSHAEGRHTKAIAANAHAEGYGTIASAPQAHAEGRGTQALGRYSHSEGTGTIVSEDCYSGHAEGYTTGVFNTTGGHSEGYGTWCADVAPHVEGYGRFNVTLTGAADSLEYSVSPLPEDWWLETYLCDSNGGSAKLIKITAIDKINSKITLETTLGELTNSTRYFIAGSYAKGGCNHVEGYVNRTYTLGSHVEGARNIIESTGKNSHAEGVLNRTTKYGGHSEGCCNISAGHYSHAEGNYNRSYGKASHAEGFGNTAFGNNAHAGGDGSLIVKLTGAVNSTTYSTNLQPKANWVGKMIKVYIDLGETSKLLNSFDNTYILITAIDDVNNTITVSETLNRSSAFTDTDCVISLGGALHDNSFAHGKGVMTAKSEQAVFGKFNLPKTDALFVVGNGISYDNPSNAFYIDANGNVHIAGSLKDLQGNVIDATKFVVVDNHSGAGDDPNKIYIPSAKSEKETHDSVMIIPSTENNASAKLKGTTNIVRAAKAVAFGDYNTIDSSAAESIVVGRMNSVGAPKGAAFGNVNSVNANNGFASGGFNKIVKVNSFAEGVGNYVNGQVAHMEGNSVLQITLTGAANATTYTITEKLPSFFIGLPVFYAVAPENNDGVAIYRHALITAIDTENNTITLDGTLNAYVALENATARVLCSTTQLKSSHVEGSHNFIILNDALTENPLQDTIINDLFNTEGKDRLQGGHVEGFGNVIAGKYSHAEGVFNLVTKQYSHAEGNNNKVLNQQAHAEGYGNIVDGNGAHAEGGGNYAHGPQSHAEGRSTKTLTARAHAEGYGTIAGANEGYANHSEGYGTVASGNSGNHSEGFATMVSGSGGAHAEGYGGYIVHLTGAENATTYSVDKAPLDNWLNSYVLNNNMVINSTRKITAIDKINNTITVDETFGAEVTPNITYKVISQLSLGSATHVEGFMNIAKGNASHAEGYNTYTSGLCSHAEGKRTVAVGKASHVQGENNIAQGDYSHSEGYGNKAFGKSSHAGGDGSLIVNLTGAAKVTTYSVDVTPTTEWVGCLIKTTIDNDINVHFSITEIDATNKTITVNETLDGTNALSNAPYSIALGGAIADYSFAHGKGVQAETEAGAVFGKFNVPRKNALFAIGNGTSYTDQKDAFYVDIDGNVYIAGNIVNAQMTQLTNKITELENRIAALEGKS
jgi:hypothetical protein